MSAEKAQHTPGPWHVLPTNDCVIESEKHGNIAITNLARKSVADARLIASAPDLLAIAKRYARECTECGGHGVVRLVDFEGTPIDDKPCHACSDIRAVIAKAEGRE